MKTYLLSGLLLQSEHDFPELPVHDLYSQEPAPSSKLRFEFAADARSNLNPADSFHQWVLPDGRIWVYFFNQGDVFRLRFPDYADFELDFQRMRVRCSAAAGTSTSTIRHLFLNQVMPLFLSKLGKLVLHAGAVRVPDGAVAFVGESGAGKSTLVAALGEFCPVMTDDCLIIEFDAARPMARGNYPGIRLWPDVIPTLASSAGDAPDIAQYSSKKRIHISEESQSYEQNPAPLRRLYMLQRSPIDAGDSLISIQKFAPTDAVIQLLQFAFVLDVEDRLQAARQLRMFETLVRGDFVRRLIYPSGIEQIPRVYDAIFRELAPPQQP